jgi:hypothetical protein
MEEGLDYHRSLLDAVEGFLRGTDASRIEARDRIAMLPPTRPFTVGDVVWGSTVSLLGDRLIQDDLDSLQRLQRLLQGAPRALGQGYLNYELRPHMTPAERACHAQLQELVDYLLRFPFDDVDAASAEYGRRKAELDAALDDMESVETAKRADEELLHRLVLREVAAVALNVDIRYSMLVAGHLMPAFDYVSVHQQARQTERPSYPDATESLQWARRALLAVEGHGWIALSWHVDQGRVNFSLR